MPMRTRRPLRSAVTLVVAIGLLAGCTSGGDHHAAGPAPTPARAAPTAAATAAPTVPVPTVTLPPDAVTPAPASASRTASGRRTATVLGSGDVLVHPPLVQQAHADALAAGRSGWDFDAILAGIAPDVRSADLATCELETPLAPPNGPFAGWPNFSAPPQVLTALKGVGYDGCTTACYHTLDEGYAGVRRTLDELDAAGLRHTGSARTRAEADRPLITTLPDGVRIGELAYAFGFNGHQIPTDRPWLANEIDIPKILAAARRMKRAGADIIVLAMHWGTEYDRLATAQQRSEARELLASPDIDLILGDHAHVVQPAERIHGKWVFYCMGNQISRHADPVPASREGIMPKVTFTQVSAHHFAATAAAAIPTLMTDTPKLRLIDVPRSLAAASTSAAQRRADTTARAAIISALRPYGALRDGLRVP